MARGQNRLRQLKGMKKTIINECTAVYKTNEATCHYDVRLTDTGSDSFSAVQYISEEPVCSGTDRETQVPQKAGQKQHRRIDVTYNH
jgi:hypothetical protein